MNLRHLSIFLIAITTLLFFGGCTKSEAPGTYTLEITPQDHEMKSSEAVTLVARMDPVPDEPVTYQWRTLAQFGIINNNVPNGEVDDVNDEGTSKILYSGTPAGNPGGLESIQLEALNPEGVKLAEAKVEITVLPPDSQIVAATFAEHTTDGDTPGRLNTLFYYAYIFEKIPGFTRYEFEFQSGPPSMGPVGMITIREFGTKDILPNRFADAVVDNQMMIDAFGTDFIGIGPTQYAWVVGGTGFSNYDPNKADHLQKLEDIREQKSQQATAVYVVRPYIP